MVLDKLPLAVHANAGFPLCYAIDCVNKKYHMTTL
jgi:hypothetical protein